jgi:hypothetical protein
LLSGDTLMKINVASFFLVLLCTTATPSSAIAQNNDVSKSRFENAFRMGDVTEIEIYLASSVNLRLEDSLYTNVPRPYAVRYLNEFIARKDSVEVRLPTTGQGRFIYWKGGERTKVWFDIITDDEYGTITGINISNHGMTNLFHNVHQ